MRNNDICYWSSRFMSVRVVLYHWDPCNMSWGFMMYVVDVHAICHWDSCCVIVIHAICHAVSWNMWLMLMLYFCEIHDCHWDPCYTAWWFMISVIVFYMPLRLLLCHWYWIEISLYINKIHAFSLISMQVISGISGQETLHFHIAISIQLGWKATSVTYHFCYLFYIPWSMRHDLRDETQSV